MGDRASLLFFDRDVVSPTVYLHWHGRAVPQWLAELKHLMQGRPDDASYACARFIGLCHTRMPGNLSLAVTRNRVSRDQVHDAKAMAALSPGDAGLVVVDAGDFAWRAYGGYLHRFDHQPADERSFQ